MERRMRFAGFGCSIDEEETLEIRLRQLLEAGFTHAEIRPRGWDLWLDGEADPHVLDRLRRARDHVGGGLSYTLHGPYELNLFDPSGVQRKLLRASLEAARAIRASAVVIHPGRMTRAVVTEAMDVLQARERDALGEVSDELSSEGISLALETWYAVGSTAYSYAIWPAQLATQIRQVGHPRIGACLDVGHLWLASRWFGFDFVDAVVELAPLVTHLHVHDNFGVLTADAVGVLGHGDLHLVPPSGNLPFHSAFRSACFERVPVVNLELSVSADVAGLTALLESARSLVEPTLDTEKAEPCT